MLPALLTRCRRALEFAEQQVLSTVRRQQDFFPIYTQAGRWHHDGPRWTDWTGGFFAGLMWQFYLRTQSDHWHQLAQRYSRLLEPRRHDRAVHDLGFLFLNTYYPWYQLSGLPELQQVLVEAGRTLALRYQPQGKYLCSFVSPDSLFIDIMMNVPLVWYAAAETGDASLEQVALEHCRTTRDCLVRPDGSTAHEGLFDPATGQFLRQSTHQGLRPDSTWARGLAWSLYGFSKCYALTGRPELLEVAHRNADCWLARLSADRVAWWDFDADLSAPLPWGPQKDSSATAIAASGLLDLARQSTVTERSAAYRQTALAMIEALLDPEYLALDTPNWQGVLKHGVYHTARGLGVDESVMWGDFFFVEALTKLVLAAEHPAATPPPMHPGPIR
jgi:unsaturated chondroitin disaccharide hydrolase